MDRVTILATAASAVLFLYILEMVRRRKLREEYSIFWLSGAVVILLFAAKRDWLEWISRQAGVFYPPSFLFLIGIFFVLLILIHFSITISRLYEMNTRMAQELALLKEQRQENDLSR